MGISLSSKPGQTAKSVVESDVNAKFDVSWTPFFITMTLQFQPKQYICGNQEKLDQ